MLLSVFYLFPPVTGALDRLPPEAAAADVVALLLPERMPQPGPDTTASCLRGLAALSTGRTRPVPAYRRTCWRRGRTAPHTGVRRFRQGTVIAAVPFAPRGRRPAQHRRDRGDGVRRQRRDVLPLLCPRHLVRGLVAGALASLIVGGGLASARCSPHCCWGRSPGGTLLIEPAAWSVPISFTVAVVVSVLTPRSVPPHVSRTFALLHTPETPASSRDR
jgi:cation/acetate symporter